MANVLRLRFVDRVFANILRMVTDSLEMAGDEKQIKVIGNAIGLVGHFRREIVGDVVIHLIDLLGFGYWSLSAYVKRRVKDAVSFIGKFEAAVAKYAEKYSVDAVLCGHIHSASIRRYGNTTYYNAGDWVESCSALVEHADGRIEIVRPHVPYPFLLPTIPRRHLPETALL